MSRPTFLNTAADMIGDLMARACPEVERPGLLVGLSGGPDSVALLLAAHHWAQTTGLPLAAAHLNHQLRGKASEQDTEFCQDLCASLDIPLHLEHEDPRPVARRRGLGLEEAGRSIRLAFFSAVLDAHPHLHCLALGHHRDDQAETVVMRLFRGTGPEGLAGIRPVAGRIIHPLLGFSRGEILHFLSERNQVWRTDASNLDGDNTRARLRRELFPLVRDIFGSGCDQTPARLAELLGPDQEYLEELTAQAAGKLAVGNGSLQIPGLLELPVALASRVVRGWLLEHRPADQWRLESAHVMNILSWLRSGQSGTGLDLPGGLRVVRDFDDLRLEDPREQGTTGLLAANCRILVSRNETTADPVALGREEGNGRLDSDGNWNLSCPADVLVGNLKVRHPRPGDRFQPFGLDGTHKLSDLCREKRIPENQRQNLLLVEDEAGIIWVVGAARGERTRMLPSSSRIVTISVTKR